MDQVLSIERIERQARADALRYGDVNAACPHPFGSEAGRIYRAAFLQARNEIDYPAEEPDAADAPFCVCNDQPCLEEVDWNKCHSCGKAFA